MYNCVMLLNYITMKDIYLFQTKKEYEDPFKGNKEYKSPCKGYTKAAIDVVFYYARGRYHHYGKGHAKADIDVKN